MPPTSSATSTDFGKPRHNGLLTDGMISFLKKRAVFCAATLCALISCLFVPPSRAYLSYIDVNTLAVLFALMVAVSGLESGGVFRTLAVRLCAVVHTTRSLSAVLVFLCFFTSMLITNDVALIAFVPFALMLLGAQEKLSPKYIAFVVVLQTIAANTGSMLTPVGNPQNLFLYNKMELPLGDFVSILLPYTAACGLLLAVSLFAVPKLPLSALGSPNTKSNPASWKKILHAVLFALCLLSVAKLIPKPVLALIVFVAVLIFDRKTLFRVDYFLLLTFVAFFVFSGNIAAIPAVSTALENCVRGHELASGLLASQVISNVPATLLLYPFVVNARRLLLGVNFGGLGTLVASLASLISFTMYSKTQKNSGLFLALFTALSVIFLAMLLSVCQLLQ